MCYKQKCKVVSLNLAHPVCVLGHDLTFPDHVTIRFPIGHFLFVFFGTKPLSLTVSMASVTQWLT